MERSVSLVVLEVQMGTCLNELADDLWLLSMHSQMQGSLQRVEIKSRGEYLQLVSKLFIQYLQIL